MSVTRTLKLGTRASVLAMAQSRLIAEAIERSHPHLRVACVTRNTRGDRELSVPLTQVSDTDFFVDTLDAALLSGEVDFCVHSLKDLGDNRPSGICMAAIPERANPRDVILFRGDIMQRLSSRSTIRIGTSSTRRTLNIADFLPDALPATGGRPQIRFHPLRGPVDQRVQRLGSDAAVDEALDGVVLALAGLSRLWKDSDGRRALENIMESLRWMVLPLSDCPAAPGQGALAVECRDDDADMRAILGCLHHAQTADLVSMERAFVQTLPDSTRQSFGATAAANTACGPIMWIRGASEEVTEGSATIRRTVWSAPPRPDAAIPWNDQRNDPGPVSPRPATADELGTNALFVAHWRAVPDDFVVGDGTRVWVSGAESWRQLARRGIWVEGCGDNLGFAALTPTLECPVLQLPRLDEWTALTHEAAVAGWRGSGVNRVIPTYAIGDAGTSEIDDELATQVSGCTHFYWASVQQYQRLRRWLPDDARHACGPGKTLDSLRLAGLEHIQAFPSRREWQQWLA